MPRKNKSPDGLSHIHLVLPPDLADRVRLRLFDPAKGRVPYGAMAGLIRALLEEWLTRNPADEETLRAIREEMSI